MLEKLVAFYVFVIFLVHHCVGQNPPNWYAKIDEVCNCGVVFNDSVEFSFGYYKPPYVLFCDGITEPENVSCLQNFLGNTSLKAGRVFEVFLANSNLDLITADLLASYNVTTIRFHHCTMSKIPYEILCSKHLFVLQFIFSPIPGSRLVPRGFNNCTSLKQLFFHRCELAEIPPGCFLGLGNLRSLYMAYNRLDHIPDFEGLSSSMRYLGLHGNPIKSLPKTAFRRLTNLTGLVLVKANLTTIEAGTFDSLGPSAQVYLSGNPFHCNCSLQWLQDWLLRNPSNSILMKYVGVEDDNPQCMSPKKGPLKTLAFCNMSKGPNFLAASQTSWLKELLNAFWQTIDSLRNI